VERHRKFRSFHRRAYLCRVLVLGFLLVSSLAGAERYEKEGLFRVDVEGWIPSEIAASSHVFTCMICRNPVQVRIIYSPVSLIDNRFRSNETFLSSLNSAIEQRAYAREIMESQFPQGTPLDILKTSLSELGGLEVFLFQAAAKTEEGLARRTIMMAVHRDRLVTVSLSYFQGSVDEIIQGLIRLFLDSIRFL